jgi:hypothetical protein
VDPAPTSLPHGHRLHMPGRRFPLTGFLTEGRWQRVCPLPSPQSEKAGGSFAKYPPVSWRNSSMRERIAAKSSAARIPAIPNSASLIDFLFSGPIFASREPWRIRPQRVCRRLSLRRNAIAGRRVGSIVAQGIPLLAADLSPTCLLRKRDRGHGRRGGIDSGLLVPTTPVSKRTIAGALAIPSSP